MFVKGLLFLLFSSGCAFRFGAVLQEKRDAHLAAALHYAVEWINHEKMWGTFALSIKYVDPVDYYEATSQACRLLEKRQITALFGSADVGLNAQLQRWTSSVNLPFFTAIDDLGIFKNKNLSPITQIDLFPKNQLVEALADLIRHWKWTRITVVFADIRRAQRLVSFLDMDHPKSVRFTFVRVRDGDFLAAARQVKEIEECGFYPRKDCSEFSRTLLDLDPEDTFNFLLAALQMGLIELKHWYLLTSMDLKTMDMGLFRHNHARYISVDTIDPTFINTTRSFHLKKFQDYVRQKWEDENPGNKNLKMKIRNSPKLRKESETAKDKGAKI
uniref:ANF_receptor domain-containing protein n=1 Tax=Steinernema glaseri TaxID=37863 RepID=A0A1I7YUT7_9BILA